MPEAGKVARSHRGRAFLVRLPSRTSPVHHPEDKGRAAGGNTVMVDLGGELLDMIEVAAITEIASDAESR
jgi:hypothetical protein